MGSQSYFFPIQLRIQSGRSAMTKVPQPIGGEDFWPLAQQEALEGPLSKLNGIGDAISSERDELLIEGSPKF